MVFALLVLSGWRQLCTGEGMAVGIGCCPAQSLAGAHIPSTWRPQEGFAAWLRSELLWLCWELCLACSGITELWS